MAARKRAWTMWTTTWNFAVAGTLVTTVGKCAFPLAALLVHTDVVDNHHHLHQLDIQHVSCMF